MVDSAKPKPDEVALIYDAQCPVCTAYSCSVGVDPAAADDVKRIDARSADALVAKATAAGLDLDEGMVVVYRDQLYHGADALHLMATLAPQRGIWNRVNRLLFRSKTVSRL